MPFEFEPLKKVVVAYPRGPGWGDLGGGCPASLSFPDAIFLPVSTIKYGGKQGGCEHAEPPHRQRYYPPKHLKIRKNFIM